MSFTNQNIRLLVSNYDIGAGKKGAAQGPSALLEILESRGISFKDKIVLNTNGDINNESEYPHCKHIDSIKEAAQKLQSAVVEAISANTFPLILSGDHSNAIGGISGLKNANPDKRIGVIWVDAHADLHSPYTTPSGNMHGMPLAVLSGIDQAEKSKNPVSEKEANAWNSLKQLGEQKISPKVLLSDIVFIGIRDAEKEEWDLIEEKNIKIFEPNDIKDHGIFYAINKGLEHLKSCDILYVSFDVDSLDASISTGTGTPAFDGLKVNEAEGVFKTLLNHPKLAAFEITEINPSLDGDGRKMAEVVAGLYQYALVK